MSDVHQHPAISLLATALISASLLNGQVSSLIYEDTEGALQYAGYANEGQANADNLMVDFSHAGYQGGGVPIPWVPVEVALDPDPSGGDDYARIQAAIDTVSARPLSSAGFRGTVLLRAGAYRVSETLQVNASGVVIRGEGQGTDGTVITFTATVQDDLFEFSGSSGWTQVGDAVAITQAVVPSGTRSFTVASTAGLAVGDRLMVRRTPNQAWIDLLGMGSFGWTPEGYVSDTPRVITAIEGDTITVDAPLVHAIESAYGGGEVFTYQFDGAIREVGIERIRLESAYTSDTDEQHGWNAVKFRQVENGWARQVTARYFGFSCIDVNWRCQYITVEDCAQLDPKSITTGGRKYSFNLDDASFVLMQRCFARGGRHDFVTGSKVPGPNVFLDGLAVNTQNDTGPHHRYAEGTLFDNIKAGQIHVQNRKSSGTGHGWAGAQTVFWNCEASGLICDTPKAAMNFAIGCVGNKNEGSWAPEEPFGIWESEQVPVTPRSLYFRQLQEREGTYAIKMVASESQLSGNIWNELAAWAGEGMPSALPAFAPLQVSVGEDVSMQLGALELEAVVHHRLPENFPTQSEGWVLVSGPASASIAEPGQPTTTVSFTEVGTYEFKYVVAQDDNRDPDNIVTYQGEDTLVVTVTDFTELSSSRSSIDTIVGRAQSNAPTPDYYVDSGSGLIGGTGSNRDNTRYDANLVLGFSLPNLPVGATLDAATISFEITANRDQANIDPALDVYLLDTSTPETSGTGFFYHGESDPNPDAAFVGSAYVAVGSTQVNYADDQHEFTLTLPAAAITVIQAIYGDDHIPDQPEVFFRFNLDAQLSDLSGNSLNRYYVDLADDESSLTLLANGGASNTYANWQQTHFSETQINDGLADPTVDADDDGLANLLEYALGGDPLLFTPQPVSMATEAGIWTATFTRPQDLADVTYGGEFSSDLETWDPGLLQVVETVDGVDTIKVADPLGLDAGPKRFFRVFVTSP